MITQNHDINAKLSDKYLSAVTHENRMHIYNLVRHRIRNNIEIPPILEKYFYKHYPISKLISGADPRKKWDDNKLNKAGIWRTKSGNLIDFKNPEMSYMTMSNSLYHLMDIDGCVDKDGRKIPSDKLHKFLCNIFPNTVYSRKNKRFIEDGKVEKYSSAHIDGLSDTQIPQMFYRLLKDGREISDALRQRYEKIYGKEHTENITKYINMSDDELAAIGILRYAKLRFVNFLDHPRGHRGRRQSLNYLRKISNQVDEDGNKIVDDRINKILSAIFPSDYYCPEDRDFTYQVAPGRPKKIEIKKVKPSPYEKISPLQKVSKKDSVFVKASPLVPRKKQDNKIITKPVPNASSRNNI